MIGAITAGLFGTGVPPVTSSYESIATVTGNGSAGTLSFTSIPSTYTHLQIRGIGRDGRAVSADTGYITLNSDSGSNWANHYINGNGSTASAGANAPSLAPSNMAHYVIAGTSAGASMYSATVIDILDYKNTNKNKTIRTMSGVDLNGSGNVWYSSGLWLSTSAITQIDLTTGTGSAWTSASTFALYGIKG